jgi:homogentisate phytyltransferase/homogentisate geranylgeranyltransferase
MWLFLNQFSFFRFPLFAALCIASVRGAVINAGFYTHARQLSAGAAVVGQGMLGGVLHYLDRKCCILTAYFAIFGVVIALMKDVPDFAGDVEVRS